MTTQAQQAANVLRHLADYAEQHPDPESTVALWVIHARQLAETMTRTTAAHRSAETIHRDQHIENVEGCVYCGPFEPAFPHTDARS
jgi:hypothetical protein